VMQPQLLDEMERRASGVGHAVGRPVVGRGPG
jgi:hypothetical protein